MTPDTSTYMIAGFIVILVGIAVYTTSLILRGQKVKRQIEQLKLNNED